MVSASLTRSSSGVAWDPRFEDKRRFGYSRDKRPDCVQVVIALIVTPEGFPLAYEVMAGNTADQTTLADFLEKIERQYGRSDRVWIMDRGIPTEETLASMRAFAMIMPLAAYDRIVAPGAYI